MSDKFNVNTIGRLTRDPEIKFLSNGTPVANFGLCTNQDYKKGEHWMSKPLWSDWDVWGDRAKWVVDKLHKGMEVYLEGEYSQRSWDDKEGVKRTAHSFRLTHFRPITRAVESDQVKVGNPEEKPPVEEDMEEEIPF